MGEPAEEREVEPEDAFEDDLGLPDMSAMSFSDDLEAHRARELSLTLQNDRLRSALVRQTSLEGPISPRQNADCSVHVVGAGEGKLVFGVHLLTILPTKTSFSVAEYVGYRELPQDGGRPSHDGSLLEKGKAFFDSLFGAGEQANSTRAHNGLSEQKIFWEILWKKSVGTGNLCRVTVFASFESFAHFRHLVKEWSTVPTAGGPAASPAVSLEPAAHGGQEEAPLSRVPRVRNSFQRNLSSKIVSESSLLLPEHIVFLIERMPDRFAQHKWDLLYSTCRDGISLQTLYRRVASTCPTILVVKDMQNHVFGVFAPDPWKVNHKFYGTGETFVFKLEPSAEANSYHWNQKEHSEAKRNNFFMFSTDDCIGVGGGGHFALWLDEDLLYGNSTKSNTFANECLSSSEVFQVLQIEVWGLSEGSGRI